MAWSSLFDHTHILKGVTVDAEIELQCRRCRTLFRTMNAYYIGYSEVHYVNHGEVGKCKHDLGDLRPTKRYFK